jgi:uncharacterized protein with HEPN domain
MPSPSRDAGVLLAGIEDGAAKILAYAAGHSRQSDFTDAMRFDAILHNPHVIGEAVKRLPPELKKQRPDIPWRETAGMRDVIAHAYFALDLDLVWDAMTRDLPELLVAVQALRST